MLAGVFQMGPISGADPLAYRIGDYQLDPLRRELRAGHTLRRLEPEVFDTLLFLVENRDRVVSKDDLVAAVWKGRIVSDSTVESRISTARKALGDDGRSQKIIHTIARRGFRFVAEVQVMDGDVRAVSAGSDKPSVAVLAIKNLSTDCDLGHFVNATVGDLTADLSRFPSLRVLSRRVTARYDDEAADLGHMVHEFGVQYTIDGSVEDIGGRVRLTVQLTEASWGTQLWSHRFDICRADLPAARDDIRMTIAASLISEGGALTKAEHQRAMRKSPDLLTARDLYCRGEAELFKFEKEATGRARTLLERSLALDPGNVGAHALLAWVHWNEVHWYKPECPGAVLDAAQKAARTCLELDAGDYRGHWVLAAVLRLRGQPDAAMAEYERAFELNHCDPDMLAEWAEFLSRTGRAEQAVSQAQRAIALNRFHPEWYLRVLDRAYYNARQYEEAIKLGGRFQNPPVSVLENVAASYARLGRNREARDMVERILGVKPDHSIDSFATDYPQVDQKVLAHFVKGLRKAGLPERRRGR